MTLSKEQIVNNSKNSGKIQPKKPFFFSIRSKMLVGFGSIYIVITTLFIFVIMFGIPLTTFNGIRGQEQTQALKSLNLIADIKKDNLVSWLKQRKDDAAVISKSSMVRSSVKHLISINNENMANGVQGKESLSRLQMNNSFQIIDQHLNLIKKEYGIYNKIEIVDALSGTIIVSTQHEDIGTNILSDDLFSKAIKPGLEEAISVDSDPLYGGSEVKITRKIYIYDNQNNAPAILIMHIWHDYFIKPFLHMGTGMGETGEVVLVNQDVKIVAALKFPLTDGTRAIPLDYQVKALPAIFAARGEEGTMAGEDYRGKKILAAFRHIRITSELGWGLMVKQDMAEVFAPMRRIVYFCSISGIIAIFLVLVIVVIIARNLSVPIQLLSRAIQEIDEGNLNFQAQINTSDEVGILARLFNTMVSSLKQSREELITKEKFTVIGRVSGSIAHDIRHPLATIKNSSYFLNMTLKDSDEKTKKHLKLIDSEINHANEIISSFIRLSETKVPEKSRVNTKEYIKEFFSKFSLPEHIKLAVELDSECPDIMIDSIQFRQVIVNIISNAVHVMPEKGTLTVKTKVIQGEELSVGSKIGESSKANRDFVEISFADTGSGIKRDDLDKIFEPFYTTRSKGMGLGLSIVKDIIVSNDGVITAESKEGKGCTFVMKFPVIKDL